MKKILFVVALALLAFANLAHAQQTQGNLLVTASVQASCSISTSPVAFGIYDPTSLSPSDAQGSITLACTKGSGTQIKLNHGTNFNGSARMPGPGGDFLSYALFQDAGRTTDWSGDPSGNPMNISPAVDSTPRVFPVYGRIPAGQSVGAGSYSDTVVVTVLY